MMNSNQAGMQKLQEASQFREKCEKQEKKAKQFRNIIATFFVLSVLLVIGSNLFMEPPLFGKLQLPGLSGILPVIEIIALPVVIISLILLVISVMRSINMEMQADKARNVEGYLAQHLYKVVLLRSKRN